MKPGPRLKAAHVNRRLILALVIIAIILIVLAGLIARRPAPVPYEYPHLKMGNPSQATTSHGQKDNYLMAKKYFALAYNNSNGTPNWVSWRLVKEDLGSAARLQFYPDMDLPAGFVRITPRDYTGGGFDRGHMCPHSDRGATDEMSEATFVMTNIIPQSPNANQKAWAQLEMYCRELVEHEGKRLYIVSGPAGQGGVGKAGPSDTIGMQHTVTVPARCWKVIMVLDDAAGDDLKKVDRSTRLIGIIMPNDMSVGIRWAGYRVPVRAVEQMTGYKFFDKAPESIIGPLKEKADTVRIPATRTPRRRERSSRYGN